MKNHSVRDILFSTLVLLSFFAPLHGKELVLNDTSVQVCFSPDGGCTGAMLRAINQAKEEILVQAYSFTSAPIRNALVQAARRGARVEVILDQGEQSKYAFKTAKMLKNQGVFTYLDGGHSNAHNKVIVIDRETVVTGSFNFTYAAEKKNAENVLIIRSRELARIYGDNWNRHRCHSPRY
jgi:phosphatidylserine/phosphatidylglycerophosphate/cardiolipin synthase-like enzyme